MGSKIKMKRVPYNWGPVEGEFGFKVYESYKEFYETYGVIGEDDYIYINNPTEGEFSENLYNYNKYIKEEVYPMLEEFVGEEFKIKFYDGESGWLTVGYTTNGDFIFCTGDKVIITDGGFENREEYDCTIIEFLEKYIKDDLEFTVITDGMAGEEKEIEIIYKTSHGI